MNNIKTKFELYRYPYEYYNINKINDYNTPINVLLVCAPCHGMGDIIFCLKIRKYLLEWYKNIRVNIATTRKKIMMQNGIPDKNIYELKCGKKCECRRFRLLKLYKKIPEHDLIFITPLQGDFKPDYNDIHKLIHWSTPMNTFIMSEYQQRYLMDINTGVGEDRDGLLFTHLKYTKPKIKNPYIMIYISDRINGWKLCVSSFLKMCMKKYRYKNLDIVAPWDICEYIVKLSKIFKNFYSRIIYDSDVIYEKNSEKTLTIHSKFLPAKYIDFIGLLKYSVKDVLTTGDQSITDALMCCRDKNIWYQVADWKRNFMKALSIHMPNKFFAKKSTACGGEFAIRWKSNYTNFIRDNDFRKKGKKKIDHILRVMRHIKNSMYWQMYKNILKKYNHKGIKETISVLEEL